MKAKPVYIVVRNCCTSGNCIQCHHVKREADWTKVLPKVCQFITTVKTMAEKVVKNFAEYKAYYAEATTEEISKLETDSAAWVREKLRYPEHINNRMIP